MHLANRFRRLTRAIWVSLVVAAMVLPGASAAEPRAAALEGLDKTIVGFRSAKARPFAERKATMALSEVRITIVLLDGHELSGRLDGQSDGQWLWLARSDRGVHISSGFPWPAIQHIHTPSGEVDPGQLRQAISQWPKTEGRLTQDSQPFVREEITDEPMTKSEIAPTSQPFSAPRKDSAWHPVQTLHVEAELASWDSDVQPDGLRVFVFPLDRDGDIAPVRGNIDLTLFGLDSPSDEPPRRPWPPRFPELERASYLVRASDFADGPAVYRLPFSRVHPDFEATLASVGMMHVRLGVNGQGVFEASAADVCLRAPSRFRDQLQHSSRHRYLPIEIQGRPDH
jgi:hypothetical protein